MASCTRSNNGRLLFKSETPHFFKIISSHSTAQHKLGIPRKFVQNYGDVLSSPVILKVPTGLKWKVDIVRCEAEIWLQKGWKEFAEYYSVVEGSLLVFEYVKSISEFNVFIFDKSATEIDYPLTLSNDERHNLDYPIGVAGEISRKRKEKSPLSSARPYKIIGEGTNAEEKEEHDQSLQKKRVKRMVTSSNCQSEIPAFEVVMQASNVHHCKSNLEIPGSFATTYMRMKDGDALLSVLDGRTWSIKYYTKTRARGQTRTRLQHSGWNQFARDNHLQVGDVCKFELIDPHNKTEFSVVIARSTIGANAEPEKRKENVLTREEKAMAVQRAVSNFRSENPSFNIVIQPSYVIASNSLAIPSSFARKYLKKKGDATFNVLDGRSWCVKYCSSTSSGTRINNSGWYKFAKENDLEVGDVCIFELLLEYIDRITFRVTISKYSNPSTSLGARKQSKEKESCRKQPNLSSDYPKRKRVGRPCKISNENHTTKKIKLQSSERTSNRDCPERQVEGKKNNRAIFKFSSQNPTFERAMQPSNLILSTKYILPVPRKFMKNMENGNYQVKLQIGNRLWSVKLIIYPYRVVFGEGWFEFARENSLKLGDVCTFELIDKEILLIRVSISRD